MIETTLRLVFTGNGDRKLTFSYPNADSTAVAATVKALMTAIVTNGAIFAEVPLVAVAAEFVSRQITPINIA
jgi:hypothetical protein